MIKIKTRNILIIIALFICIALVLSVSSGFIGSDLNDNSKQTNSSNITINLDTNPSTGYYWEVSNETTGVKLISQTFISDNNDEKLVGVGGVEKFIFSKDNSEHYLIKINKISPSGEIVDSFIQSDLFNKTAADKDFNSLS